MVKIKKPKHLVAVYDNGGKTVDRYTVAMKGKEYGASPRYQACLGLSAKPDHPQGFSQWGDCKVGKHLGKKIPFSRLPEHIQKHVLKRV